jgi:hypothetical protein
MHKIQKYTLFSIHLVIFTYVQTCLTTIQIKECMAPNTPMSVSNYLFKESHAHTLLQF